MRRILSLFLLICCLSLIFTACQQPVHKNEPNGKTFVSGHFRYPEPGMVYFRTYADSSALFLENKTSLDSIIPDKHGDFSFSFDFKTPVIFDLENSGRNLATNLFVCPGDKINLVFNDTSYIPALSHETEAEKFNDFLVKFRYAFYQDPDIKNEYYIGSNYMDGHNFRIYNDRRKEAQMEFFEKFFAGDSLRTEYRNYAMASINYGIAVDRLMYVWKKRIKNQTTVLDPDYFDFETKEFLENPAAFYNTSYIHFLKLYIKDKFERMLEEGVFSEAKPGTFHPTVEKYKLCMKLLNPPFRDVVLYSLILSDMNDVTNKTVSHSGETMPLDSMISWFRMKYSLTD